MKRPFVFCIAILCLFVARPAEGKIIHVPADSSTIQAGINGAVDGDTVLVTRGHYYERIDFLGRGVLVASNFIFDHDAATIDSTIMDADTSVLGSDSAGSVVVFDSRSDTNSAIVGFTIQNGLAGTGGRPHYCADHLRSH